MDFASLTKAHHALRIIVDNAQKEAEQAKNLANNALAGTYRSPCFYSYADRAHKPLSVMEPLIDSDATLKRAADTKAVLRELQDDLAACMAIFYLFFFLSFMKSFKPNELQIYSVINFITNQLY